MNPFTRRFYFAFGVAGFALDYIAHYLQAVSGQLHDPALATVKLMAGWNDVFFQTGQWAAFSIGVVAHSMFLLGFVLLAVRAD